MSFVGTRPEVPRYVAAYTNEMKATLLLPAGVTSVASIAIKMKINFYKMRKMLMKSILMRYYQARWLGI